MILKILPFVIYWKETIFSNVNATSNNAFIGGEFVHFEAIDFDKATRTFNPLHDPKYEKNLFQAEVLIKEHIPIRYIKIKKLVKN